MLIAAGFYNNILYHNVETQFPIGLSSDIFLRVVKGLLRTPQLITINRVVDVAAHGGTAKNSVLSEHSQIHIYYLLYYFLFHAFLPSEFLDAKITPYRGILLRPKKNGPKLTVVVFDLNNIPVSFLFIQIIQLPNETLLVPKSTNISDRILFALHAVKL